MSKKKRYILRWIYFGKWEALNIILIVKSGLVNGYASWRYDIRMF